MAIESIGYAGSITDAELGLWTRLTGGSSCTVLGASDFKVTPAAGDRTVAVAVGMAASDGVVDTSDAVVNVVLPSVTSGSRWDLIGLRRLWSSSTTSVGRIEGTSAKVIPDRPTDPGDESFQPLALVRVVAGSTTIQEIIDLRVWSGDGGATASDDLVRSYFDRIGTMIMIGDRVWARRVSVSGSPEWVLVADVSGASYLEMTSVGVTTGAESQIGAAPLGAYTEISDRLGWHDPTVNPVRITPNIPGRYRITINERSANFGADKFIVVWKNGVEPLFGASTINVLGGGLMSASGVVTFNGTTDFFYVNLWSGGATGYSYKLWLTVEYLGPVV